MSIWRYLTFAYLIWVCVFIVIVAVTWEPEAMATGFYARLAYGIPLGAAAMTAPLYRSAKKTPPDRRSGFRAYREANFTIGAIVAVMAAALAYVLLTAP